MKIPKTKYITNLRDREIIIELAEIRKLDIFINGDNIFLCYEFLLGNDVIMDRLYEISSMDFICKLVCTIGDRNQGNLSGAVGKLVLIEYQAYVGYTPLVLYDINIKNKVIKSVDFKEHLSSEKARRWYMLSTDDNISLNEAI